MIARCPACNPLHTARGNLVTQRRKSTTTCGLCNGSREVPVDVAGRYVASINGVTPPTASVRLGVGRRREAAS